MPNEQLVTQLKLIVWVGSISTHRGQEKNSFFQEREGMLSSCRPNGALLYTLTY